MSEPIGMCIEIGGTLPASLIETFFEAALNDIDNITGPTTCEEIEALSGVGVIRYDGTANYGLCRTLTKFCYKHKLSFVQTTEANGDSDADICYWKPGMKEIKCIKTDTDHHPTIRVSSVQPLIQFMLELIVDGDKALPKFINTTNENIKELVKIGTNKGYAKMTQALRKTLKNLLPADPVDVPVIVIDETK